MAQKLPTMVTSAKGKEYSSDSTQGQVIVQAKADAAAKAATSQPFSADSSALASITPVLESISSNVMSISETLTTIVAISQADSRGDALNKSNVPQDDLKPETSEQLSSGQMRDRGEDSDGGGLGGLMGIGAAVGGFGKGLSFWGTPLAMAGAATFVLFLGGLALVAYLGAKAFGDGADDIARGMETLSNADVDTDKVIALGEALSIFGLAMAAEGLGKGIGGLGTLVGGIATGLAGFLGIEGKDPMVALKEFAKTEITEAELKQIEINARGLTVFSAAMTVDAAGGAVQSVAKLVSGAVDALASLFPEGRDPMLEMLEFAEHKVTDDQVKQIKKNALALVGFSTAMATIESIGVIESIAKLASGVLSFVTNFFPKGEDPMLRMIKFSNHKVTDDQVKQIGTNALALVGFTTAMATIKSIGVVEDIAKLASGVVRFVGSFFPKEEDPMLKMIKFASHKITQDEVDQITLNAKALVNFSKAMGIAKGMGAAADITSMFGGIANAVSSFFGFDDKDPMAEMKLFAKEKITEDEVKQIELNARGLVAFSKAMALYSASGAAADSLNLVGSIAKGVTKFFGGTTGIDYDAITKFAAANLQVDKITSNALALSTFATAMKDMASDKIGVEWKNIGANILGAIGGFFGGDANANMMKNFDSIDEFTKRTLNLAVVDNNIKAINKFMEFGQSWVGFKGGDFDGVSDFAEGLVRSANGIHTAMYGGEYVKGGFNMKIKDGKGLAGVELMDMTNAGMGIAVLRHSLTNNAPLQELRAVSAELDTSTGATVTIVDSSIKNSSSATHIIELDATPGYNAALDEFNALRNAE